MTATPEDLRQILDGTITETGREPRNIQVQLSLEKIELMVEGGTFCTTIITTNPEVDLPTGEEGKSSDSDLESEVTESTVMAEWRLQVESLTAEKEAMAEAITCLEQELRQARERAKAVWRTSCTQLEECDRIIADRDATIATLTEKMRRLEGAPVVDTPPTMTATRTTPIVTTTRTTPGLIVTTPARTAPAVPVVLGTLTPTIVPSAVTTPTSVAPVPVPSQTGRKRKAPPISFFSGQGKTDRIENWFPILERAAVWNGWTTEEKLMQLPGYLQGEALHEWNLLSIDQKKDYDLAKKTTLRRLDNGARVLAAHDFRHVIQKPKEPVATYVSRLGHTFRVAYEHDPISTETRDMLMHSQLQEGLSYKLMQSQGP